MLFQVVLALRIGEHGYRLLRPWRSHGRPRNGAPSRS